MDSVVQAGGLESNADRDQSEHLVVLLRYRIILGVLLEVLGPGLLHVSDLLQSPNIDFVEGPER